jgi:hypothetical protein
MDQVGKIRISEAMRLGAMQTPQAFGTLFEPQTTGFWLWKKTVTATCAMGAALHAVGNIYLYQDHWFPVLMRPAACPACGQRNSTVENTIMHLNDSHEWSRERIADWVEKIEVRMERQTPVAVDLEYPGSLTAVPELR